MAILKIAKMGDPALRTPAREVPDPADPKVQALVRDMVETMADAGGVGLAAPQVHVPLRIVVFHEPPEEKPEEGAGDGNGAAGAGRKGDGADGTGADGEEAGEKRDLGRLHVLINPVVEPIGEEKVLGWEGCLSVPGMRGLVPRFTRIRYRAKGLDGREIEREAEGFLARVVQHECDHVDGVLYPQRIPDLRLFGFNEEFDRHPLKAVRKEAGEAGEGQQPEAAQAEAEAGTEGAGEGNA